MSQMQRSEWLQTQQGSGDPVRDFHARRVTLRTSATTPPTSPDGLPIVGQERTTRIDLIDWACLSVANGFQCFERMAIQFRTSGGRFLIPSIVLLFWAAPFVVSAKHVAPTRIDPIVCQGIRYVVPNAEGLRAYVEAWDLATDRMLWKKTIVRHFYFPFVGTECMHYEYINTMTLNDGHLIFTTDRGRGFSLDLRRRTVHKLRIARKTWPRN
jgi:hypothetical protein